MFINKLLIVVFFLTFSTIWVDGTAVPHTDRSLAFRRAESLDNGVSISWLEQTWNNDILDKEVIKAADLQLLKQLGFKSIRLPIAFAHFQNNTIYLQKVLSQINESLKLCNLYGFKLIICYHSGNLNDDNYETEVQNIIAIWSKVALKYRSENAENLFFEIYNEPPHMDPQKWNDAATQIISAIRKIDNGRTLIVGASNFNSIYELSRTTPLNDDNIIYTFHFYEPFFFTHQGADWIGDQVATIDVPFPYDANHWPALDPRAKGTPGEANYDKYNKDGNEQSVHDKLQIIKDWAARYNVPILCGEYGVYNKYADPDSRCRYIKAVRQSLKTLNIPGMLWDYNGGFSIFDGQPAIHTLPGCMRDAIGYSLKK